MYKVRKKFEKMAEPPKDLSGQCNFYFYNKHLLTKQVGRKILYLKEAKHIGWDKLNLSHEVQAFYKSMNPETLQETPREKKCKTELQTLTS